MWNAGQSCDDIAEAMGSTPEAVAMMLTRARKAGMEVRRIKATPGRPVDLQRRAMMLAAWRETRDIAVVAERMGIAPNSVTWALIRLRRELGRDAVPGAADHQSEARYG